MRLEGESKEAMAGQQRGGFSMGRITLFFMDIRTLTTGCGFSPHPLSLLLLFPSSLSRVCAGLF